MFLLLCVAVLFGGIVLAGGRLSRLGALRLRRTPLLLIALALQVVVTEVLIASRYARFDDALHVLSYLLAAVVLWSNRRVPGLVLVGVGAATNGLVIALNGGELPASSRALADAHIHHSAASFANSGQVAHPVLAWLGDIVATPSWLPLQNVISIGDLMILAGAGWLCVATCGTRWSPAVGPAAPSGATETGSTPTGPAPRVDRPGGVSGRVTPEAAGPDPARQGAGCVGVLHS